MFNTKLCTVNCGNNECFALKFRERYRQHLKKNEIVNIVESGQMIFDKDSPSGRYPNSDEILDKAEAMADRILYYYGF